MKCCVRCGVEKPDERFYRQPRMRDGLDSWCKDCHSEYRKQRYVNNREHELARNRRWEIANPDKVKEKWQRRYAKHGHAMRAAARAWNEANPDRKRELWNDWARRNPDKVRELWTRRRARHAAASGTASAEAIHQRFAFYGFRCWMCGDEAEAIDHVIALSRGGSNWPANLRPACRRCNSRKGNRRIRA